MDVTEGDRPISYCGQCGNPIYEGDGFCGKCGAAVLPTPRQAEQEIPEPAVPAGGTPLRNSRRRLFLVGAVAALLILVVGTSVLAIVALNSGTSLLGGSEPRPANEANSPSQGNAQDPVPPPEPTQPTTTSSSTQPSYEEQEDAQLEQFARRYDEAIRRGDSEATYSMLDESSQQQFTEEEWAQKQQALIDVNGLPAPLDGVTVDQNEEVTDVPARVTLYYEDGTQETIVAGVPMVVKDPSDAGEPKRFLTEEEISELEELSSVSPQSTTSATPEATTQSSTFPGSRREDQVREAVEQYYYAVDYENWAYTYYNLDSESKSLFTQEEWTQKNQWYADNEDLKLATMSIDVYMARGDEEADVTVHRTFEDGTTITRETVFVYEKGWWRHHLTEEEKAIFMPGVPYEEFVAAQQ